ncbi:MAG: hypothetical protein AVDCRST_MAG73-1014 [uncultured Thermomicrobiales bacterium]|uniref:Uncharacterized protein n=1 Tax=uncultured Thermomicrobiales bacterium TaxID=1645740 RepID=A0A6J4TTK7_9BACT|nr:MAG: hypothetical protein AVDCRST_MAG73-1014 [uncultured Thermomicrobiales bacterium]
MWASTRSPVWWPKASFTCLKASTSRKQRPTDWSKQRARANSSPRRSIVARWLSRPVIGSMVARCMRSALTRRSSRVPKAGQRRLAASRTSTKAATISARSPAPVPNLPPRRSAARRRRGRARRCRRRPCRLPVGHRSGIGRYRPPPGGEGHAVRLQVGGIRANRAPIPTTEAAFSGILPPASWPIRAPFGVGAAGERPSERWRDRATGGRWTPSRTASGRRRFRRRRPSGWCEHVGNRSGTPPRVGQLVADRVRRGDAGVEGLYQRGEPGSPRSGSGIWGRGSRPAPRACREWSPVSPLAGRLVFLTVSSVGRRLGDRARVGGAAAAEPMALQMASQISPIAHLRAVTA